MNDLRTRHDDDAELDRPIRDALASIMDTAPPARTAPTDPHLLESSSPTNNHPRLVVAAAAVMLIVGVGGLIALNRPGDVGVSDSLPDSSTPSAPAATASIPAEAPVATTSLEPSTSSTVPSAVRGVPICGSELPVTVEVPAATSGPNPGPAVYWPTTEGQFAQYWELPAGTIEVRWPADARELYDIETPRVRGDSTVFDGMSASVPEDGSQLTVTVPNLDASPITLTTSPNAAGLQAPCNLLQVRYIDLRGNQTTRGYNIANFNTEPMFGTDLNPLVTSTDSSALPDPETVASCGNDINDTVSGPNAPSAAEALLGFLESDEAQPGLMASGYSEFTANGNEVIYAYINDDRLITHITVTRTGTGWAVTHLNSAGC